MARTRRVWCFLCQRHFSSPTSFDQHMVGAVPADRRCLSIGELRAAGMTMNKAGSWITKRPRLAAVATGSYLERRRPECAVQREQHYPVTGVPIDPRHVLGVAAHATVLQIEAAFRSMDVEARSNPAGYTQALYRLRAARAALLNADGL